MTDRKPTAPGQYKMTVTVNEAQKLLAGEQVTVTLLRDDQPVAEGTPYNKASVLPDDLAAVICPDVVDPTPADALRALAGRGLIEVWVNASPESSFSEQTVTPERSLARARFVCVDFLAINTGSTHIVSGLLPVNDKNYATFYHSTTGTIFRRQCRASSDGVHFGNGVNGEKDSDVVMVPQTIYAIY